MIDPYVAAERPGSAWPISFFIAFLTRFADGLGPGRSADFRATLASLVDSSQQGYRNKQVGARSLAPVVLLLQYESFVMDADLEPALQRHVLITVCKAIEKELSKDEPNLTDRACTAAMLETLYKPLMPAWRKTIEFCFYSYRKPLDTLISASSSLAAWENAIRDIFPYLWLPAVAPIYQVEYRDRFVVDNPERYGETPASYSNEVRTAMPFYARLFTRGELQAHADERKMIDEVFAHLTATTGGIAFLGNSYLARQRSDVLEIAREEGRLAAQQKVLLLKSHSLAIPTFFADSLMEELGRLG